MLNRRRFLSLSALSSLLPATLLGQPKPKKTAKAAVRPAKPGPPTVFSTWNQPKANAAAEAVLRAGGSALDAVEAGVRIPEADPNDTSVGYGGLPDRDGHVTLDACIMDERGRAGSVTFLEGIMHPISVARAVMEKTPHVMLSGKGAQEFALAQGFKIENLLTPSSEKEWKEWLKTAEYKPKINVERHDTIGMLAIDAKGNLSGACTTSGLAYKMHGRVGDSPIIGSGLFVDNDVAGAVATGLGELVMRTCGAFLAVELVRNGMSPQKAADEVIRRIIKRQDYTDAQVGILVLGRDGRYGAASIQPDFNYTLTRAGKTSVVEAGAFLKRL